MRRDFLKHLGFHTAAAIALTKSKPMKRFFYLGSESEQQMVGEVMMEFTLDIPHSEWKKVAKDLKEHLLNARRYPVIGSIPTNWKVGEEVVKGKDFELDYQCRDTEKSLDWVSCSQEIYMEYTDGWLKNRRRIVVYPFPTTLSTTNGGE
jgi:hypothetical protein